MATRQLEPADAGTTQFGSAAERRHVVAGKLAAPPLRPGIVDRPELVDSLVSAPHAPVVLVSAPAGYGKTTLLMLWQQREQRPFAWLSVGRADNDPVMFVAGVLAALDPILQLGGAIAGSLNAPAPPIEDVVLPELVDAWSASQQPFVFVLDDVHLVTEMRCHKIIDYLSHRLPAGCQLTLATRSDPALPLATLRAHGRLLEVRAADLALSQPEAAALLAAAGVRLSDDQVDRLVDRTEGWPAALYLAALSLRGRSHPEDFVDRFAGTSRHVADFLSEDVLARQPDGVIDFLLQTCILEELTPSLCQALTGRTDAEAALRELERSNLFVVPLDDERWAYRYHHLFAQYLRAELARRTPELVTELHRRAWRWYREHGLSGHAIAHAQAAGDVDVAATLVAAEYSEMVQFGHIETVRQWIAGFDDRQIAGHAPLALAAAWVAALTGERERAARFAEVARHGSWEGPMPDGTTSLESAVAIMSSAFGHHSVSRMYAVAQRAVELEQSPSRHRAVALELLGIALLFEGDFARAREALTEAVELAGDQTTTGAMSLAHLALINLREGEASQAWDHARCAYEVVEQPRMRNDLASVATYSLVAHLLIERADLDGAALAVERASVLLPRLTEAFWWLMIETRLLLAPVLATLGRREDALSFLNEVESLLQAHPDAGQLPTWYEETVEHLQRAEHRRQTSTSLSDAERRILRLLATDLTLREIGRELCLSLNTVKTHTHWIYRKLGVSTRSEAVKVSREQAYAARGDSPG